MIAFAVIPGGTSQGIRLFYRRDEYSFLAQPVPSGRGVSVVVNDVQLWFDDEGRVLYVDGYCPYQGWQQTKLSPPAYSSAGLVVTDPNPKSVPSGTAVGINDLSSRWSVFVNPMGWVCIGDPADHGDKAIEFAPSSVVVLRGDQLIALWLHPTMLEGG